MCLGKWCALFELQEAGGMVGFSRQGASTGGWLTGPKIDDDRLVGLIDFLFTCVSLQTDPAVPLCVPHAIISFP